MLDLTTCKFPSGRMDNTSLYLGCKGHIPPVTNPTVQLPAPQCIGLALQVYI